MRFGCCINELAQIETLRNLGYDFFEMSVGSVMKLTSNERKGIVCAAREGKSLPLEACNVFIPSEYRLTGSNVDMKAIRAYLETALSAVSEAGARLVVFGSGGARQVEDNFPMERAYEQLADFLRMASDIAEPLGVSIAIEPLSKKECNILHKAKEACALAGVVARDNVQVLIDYYHMYMNGDLETVAEDIRAVDENNICLIHTHIADPTRDRFYPVEADTIEGFFEILKEIGYDGSVSIEGRCDDFETDAQRAIGVLREVSVASD